MKILFVAADRMEFPGVLRHASAIRTSNFGVDWARQVVLNGNEALLVANGVGRVRAAAGTKAAIESFGPDAVVSTGFCGALSPALEIGGIVIADRVIAATSFYAAQAPASGPKPPAPSCGPIRSISYVAQTAGQKRELASEGAIAVEMEAAGVASEASNHSLPFYCVRAVTDLAGETMANDFNKALRSDGHFATMNIFRAALRDPANRFPELIRLRKRCILAARALGEFFADNRF
jgi:adenosylhomocysteine nucleosidase